MRPQTNAKPAKVTGIVLMLVGVGLAALALLADPLDFGGGEGFGYQQLIVLIVGIALILAGVRIVAQSAIGRLTERPDGEEYDPRDDRRRA